MIDSFKQIIYREKGAGSILNLQFTIKNITLLKYLANGIRTKKFKIFNNNKYYVIDKSIKIKKKKRKEK